MLPDETKLYCRYFDGEHNHELTLAEFKDRLKEEDKGWLQGVLAQLETQGFVSLRFATYTVLKEQSKTPTILVMIFLLISSLCFGQDTIPVYIYADDTTYRPDLWYPVQDAYGDTTITRWSNEYYTTLWGWEIEGDFYAMDFQPLDPKYRVLSSEIRTKDLYGNPIGSTPEPPAEIIVEDNMVTVISRASSRDIYFMGEPIIKRGKR